MQLKLVSTESLLFLYLNTKVGFQQSRRSVSFSVKEEMSTTDEGPSHPHKDLNQVAHLLDGFSQSLVPPGRVSVCDQAHDNLPNQVPSLVSALSQDVAPHLIDLVRSRSLPSPESPPCSNVYPEQFSEVPGPPEYPSPNRSETIGALKTRSQVSSS